MLIYMTPKFNYVYMTLCCLTDIDLYQKYITLYIYIIWCLLGYICSCFLHTLDRLVRGYKLSRFCTLPRKSRRFIAREQKLVYSIYFFLCLCLTVRIYKMFFVFYNMIQDFFLTSVF